MKKWHVIVILGLGSLLAAIILPALARAKQYSGPSVQWNLMALEIAKARWAEAHKTGEEWPKMQEVQPYLTNAAYSATFAPVRPRNREIYIINKIGAPVYAYDPLTERLVSANSNSLQAIEQMK